MNNLIIRKYENNDFKETINLLKDNFKINNNITELENEENSFGIVATINEKIIGYTRIDKLKNIGKNCYYYYLNYVCVNTNYQNQNIGSSMLDYIFNKAKEDNIEYIELTSKKIRKAANHLYLKKEFKIKKTNVFIKSIK